MGTNFGMLRHDTYTKYLSRHEMNNVADTLLYGNDTTLLDEKKPLLWPRLCHAMSKAN